MHALPLRSVPLLLLPAVAAAQETPRLLVAQTIVDAPSGKKLCDLGIADHVRHAFPVAGQTFVVADRTVDLADPVVLEVNGGRLTLRVPGPRNGEASVLWQRALADVGAAQSAAGQRLLTRARVVVPRAGGGLLALRRSSGEEAWQQAGSPGDLLLADADLVIAAGIRDGKARVAAFALANGAVAFRAELPGKPLQLAAAPHGIVVLGDGFLIGLDRAGPKLFELAQGVESVVAGPAGWFTLAGTRIEAIDRNGKPRWSTDLDASDFRDTRQLLATAAGDLLVICNQRMSDSGVLVQLRSGRDGSPVWARDLPGLEVAHSKYWHHAYARNAGAHVYVVSQGTAGAFYEQLDLASGEQLARHGL
jgi:outer membrane protein assembly factor BamB